LEGEVIVFLIKDYECTKNKNNDVHGLIIYTKHCKILKKFKNS